MKKIVECSSCKFSSSGVKNALVCHPQEKNVILIPEPDIILNR